VESLLASWRVIETKTQSKYTRRTAAENARRQATQPKSDHENEEDFQKRIAFGPTIATLIDEYEADPVAVRLRLRRTPGVREHYAGCMFALVVFYSDDFIAEKSETPDETRRFFKINAQLPLDLQMVLCNRMFGSGVNIVLSRDSEPGFRWLSRYTTWETPLPV